MLTERSTRYGEAKRYFLDSLALDTSECILWPYSLFATGYGKINLGGHTRRVHLEACERAHGPQPPGADAAHSCRNRHCFNPRHLSWKTRRQNEADKLRDDTHIRGERHPLAKLTQSQVIEIRRRYAAGSLQRLLAAQFEVSQRTISDIVRGYSWKWLAQEKAA